MRAPPIPGELCPCCVRTVAPGLNPASRERSPGSVHKYCSFEPPAAQHRGLARAEDAEGPGHRIRAPSVEREGSGALVADWCLVYKRVGDRG